MKQYISEYEAIYQDHYHGQFSRKLAMWAVSNMRVKDTATGKLKAIIARSMDDVEDILKSNDINIPHDSIYTALYLFNMAVADYPKTLTTDKQRALFVEETLCDPDGERGNVLACFVAKMCNAGVPIFWEEFI